GPERRKRLVRFCLVPDRSRRDVVLQWLEATLPVRSRSPAEGLNGDPQVFLETDRIRNVPAIHTKAIRTIRRAVWFEHLRQTRKGCGECPVLPRRILEVPRPSEVIFRAGPADR